MRYAELSCARVRRAIQVYIEHAWGVLPEGPTSELVAGLKACHELDVMLELFESESSMKHRDGSGQGGFRRFAVRLGNSSYPFMKLVIQEYLVGGEFFFSVDTHDNLGIGEENPDFKEWQQLKRRNRELKIAIEAAWELEGIPTHADLQALMEELAEKERSGRRRARILVVDDETHVAFGIRALLSARGHEVELAHDGLAALAMLASGSRFDLVLLDNDMPELDGRSVLRELRRLRGLEDLPVLMTTASRIELTDLERASGLLRKPYPRQVLCSMIDRLLPAGG